MAQARPRSEQPKRKMTLAETREHNSRILRDPKTQTMVRESLEASLRGEGTCWEDLKRPNGGH